MAAHDALIDAVRAGLRSLADPVKAPEMQAYMKSEMPFLGVQKPARAALAKELLAAHVITDRPVWTETVLRLWRDAEYREERYLALEVVGHKAYARWQDPATLPVYRELLVTGAWWDFVDEIAARRIGPLLRAHRAEVEPVVRSWMTDEDRWLRRTSVICQLGARGDTDDALLTDAIEANIAEEDFFLRKGIGWALREYAKTEPGWVRTFVHTHPDLSPLSRREALKHL